MTPAIVVEPPPAPAPAEAPLAVRSVRSHAAHHGPQYEILSVIADGDASYLLAADGFTSGELVRFERDGTRRSARWPGSATERGPALVALEHELRLAVTNGYALVWADLAP